VKMIKIPTHENRVEKDEAARTGRLGGKKPEITPFLSKKEAEIKKKRGRRGPLPDEDGRGGRKNGGNSPTFRGISGGDRAGTGVQGRPYSCRWTSRSCKGKKKKNGNKAEKGGIVSIHKGGKAIQG